MPTNSISYQHKVADKYYKNPKARKANALRKAARRIMEKKWLVKPFDWKEVDHKQWTAKWNWASNLRVISRLKNRILWQKKATASQLANNNK